MVEPEKLLPFMKEPEDFDAFWDKVKAELAAVPMKELERIPIPDPKVQVFDVKIACAGEKPVSGYLCMPKDAKPKSCPALVSFHGAGVRSSRKHVKYAGGCRKNCEFSPSLETVADIAEWFLIAI